MERDASPWGGGGMDWASLPGKARGDLPQSVPFNGRDVAIYTFAQIDRLGKKSLKERCMNMRDLVGAAKLPRFSPGMQDEQMVAWLLEAQTIVANACGFSLTVADLGAPKGGDGVGAFLTHLQNAPSPAQPPPPQFQQQPQYQQQPPPQARQPPPQPQGGEYDVERILDVRTDATGMASHFLIKWLGYGAEEATWEPAAQMQAVAPHLVVQFKQQFAQRQQQQRQPPPQHFQSPSQHQYQQPPQQFQQRQQYQQPPHFQQQQQYQPTDLRGNPLRSPQGFSPPAGSPMRPDQEADMAREQIRKRNMGSNPFG